MSISLLETKLSKLILFVWNEIDNNFSKFGKIKQYI